MNKIKDMVVNLIEISWPMVVISIIIISSLRIAYLIKNEKKFIFYKEFMSLLVIVYILFLFQIVTFQDVSWSSNNFIPFKEITRYQIGSTMFFRNVLGNILLFAPYGFLISYYVKFKKPIIAAILTLIASLSIETTQLIIGRVFDVDDIILNVIGGLIGFYLYYILNRISTKMPNFLKKEWILNMILVIIIVLVGGYIYLW